MYKEFDRTYISNVFPCALEYGDYSGLNDNDISSLDEWLLMFKSMNVYFEYGDESEFERCDITGLMADCVELVIYEWS